MPLPVTTRILCRFGSTRLLVLLFAWLTLLPITLFFPQTEQVAILFNILLGNCIRIVYYDNMIESMLQE